MSIRMFGRYERRFKRMEDEMRAVVSMMKDDGINHDLVMELAWDHLDSLDSIRVVLSRKLEGGE